MNFIKKNCENIEYIKIPKIYNTINKNVIIMEYINGIPLTKIPDNDYYECSKLMLKFGLITALVHGFTHGDLHGGNVLFIKDPDSDYKLGVIDFGIIYSIDLNLRVVLFELITCMYHLSPKELTEKVINSGIFEPSNIIDILPKEHYDKIINISIPLLKQTISKEKKPNLEQLFTFIILLFNYLNENGLHEYNIKLSDEFIKLQLVLGMTQGVILTLCKNKHMEITEEVIEELFHVSLLHDN
jgi:predicted unusual protein kinase regulating ubiquinone biosynthesis (AarF/ABC1/UbiB family)